MAEAVGREMWSGLHGDERRFIRITPADFTRGGEARLDAEARFIFDLLMHVRGVTLFFDEIDDLLRSRATRTDPNFIKLIVPAMLNRLQDLRDAAPRQQILFHPGDELHRQHRARPDAARADRRDSSGTVSRHMEPQ